MNMFNTKPAASLSSGLLARKGQARPAMRPQGFVGMTHETLEDLGWNDMGDHAPIDHVATPLTPSVPAPTAQEAPPPVLRQRERLDHEFGGLTPMDGATSTSDLVDIHEATEMPVAADPVQPAPVVEPQLAAPDAVRGVSLNTAKRLRKETTKKRGKAAFTLRLDSERHLRLRLASAVCNQSAQNLVTQALDAFLENMPEVDDLMDQLGTGQGR